MSKQELLSDPVVRMLLEDVKTYLAGDKSLLSEAKRSIGILKKEYKIGPSFVADACDAGLGEVSEVW
ncbi:hypothetical protein NF212_25305 (plasmid) [Parasalinivibrio latis]|uniref:hypothetical protein n=1 Tax=Parasalinivibrio latis TaxID=2952610 RepID=UPI0030E4F2B2